MDIIGEKVGSLQGQPFAGWYTDTAVVDPDTGTVVIAWARWDADAYGNDFIYLAFFKPIDADGDGYPEAYQKIVKLVEYTKSLTSIDSLTIGKIYTGAAYDTFVLLTWTYHYPGEYNNVKVAIYDIDGNFKGKYRIAYTDNYEEYSRSCYVSGYYDGYGGFLITYWNGTDKYIYGKWLYYDTTNGWTLTNKFQIAYTNLYYTKADQMLCIGGNSNALVVYRTYVEGIDVYAVLVDTSSSVSTSIKLLFDNIGIEDTVGVRGDYLFLNDNGYYTVPLIRFKQTPYVIYQIITESGYILANKTLTTNGEHPYIIHLSDRFVAAWINKYYDPNGDPKVANIDPSTGSFYPAVVDSSSDYAKHPLIGYGSKYLIYVWTGGSSSTDYDIKYAKISLGTYPTDTPYVYSSGTLVSETGNQKAHGLGVAGDEQYVVVYTDLSDSEEDLQAYVTLPDYGYISDFVLLFLPRDADNFRSNVTALIDNAESYVYVAMAYFVEESPGADGSISKALVDAKNRGVDVKVIIDDADVNEDMYRYLDNNGVSIINDSSAGSDHIMHNKFMVVDGEAVLVSTVNFVNASFGIHNNTAIIINCSSVAYFYAQEFLHMWNSGVGRFGTDKTEDYSFIAFTSYPERLIVMEGYFSPLSWGMKPRIPEMIAAYVNRTAYNMTFAAFLFTNSSWVDPLYYAIVNTSNAGKDVLGVINEELNVDTLGKRLYWFIDEGVPIAISNHPYVMHAKIFTVDDKIAVVGSWNPTGSATTENDENILVIRDSIPTGFADEIANYVRDMYNGNNFVRSPYQYVPQHLLISKVMFYPDTTGYPDLEWVEIYNPTDDPIYLGNLVIGDSDNLLSDNEGMYRFPDDTIPPGGYVVVAYDASKFEDQYGFKPTYEIAGTDPSVPDLTLYDASRFTGSWDLNDLGDEVILAKDEGGFLVVIDAVWYGNSPYMGSAPTGSSRAPLDITGISAGDGIVLQNYPDTDAIVQNVKYTIQVNPQPVPEPWLVAVAVLVAIGIGMWFVRKRRAA